MRVVLDCNVFISAGLNPGTARAAVLHCLREHTLVASAAIALEYEQVAARPRFMLARPMLLKLYSAVLEIAVMVNDATSPICLPDPDDEKYLAAAVAGRAAAIITGNSKHFPQGEYAGVRILTPRMLLDWAT